MKRLILLLTMALCTLCLYGQDAAEYRQIAGEVSDSGNSKPLHYASVTLAGTNISNVTNSEGVFTLKVPAPYIDNGIVTISHIGYATVTLEISDFKGFSNPDKPLKISIAPINLKLDPAVIRARDPEELLKAALFKIKDNFPMEPTGMVAFYREMVKKGSNKYLALNEAVVDINKSQYDSYHADRAGIYKGRGSQNYDSSDTLFIKYQGGLLTLLEIDQAKHPFASVRLQDIGSFYDFKSEPTQMLGEKFFYVVSFNQKQYADDILFRGKVFIDSETLAIGRTEISMNVEGREEAVGIFVLKQPQNVKFEVLSAEYIVNYKQSGDKWYYDYAKAEVKFATQKRHSLFRNHFTVMSELAVTDHRPGFINIENDARIKFKDMMSEKVTDFTDEKFWENYNIIEPDQSIDNIIRKIVRQLKKHNIE